MPNQPKTPSHPIRMDRTDWNELGQLGSQLGTDRSAIIRDLVNWWMRRPGAKLPPRPARQPGDA